MRSLSVSLLLLGSACEDARIAHDGSSPGAVTAFEASLSQSRGGCPRAASVTRLPYTTADFPSRQSSIDRRIEALEAMVEVAEGQGLAVLPERATLATARRFQSFARYDHHHALGEAPALSGVFQKLWWLEETIGENKLIAYARKQGRRELDETRVILDHAALRLERACKAEHRRLDRLPDPTRYRIGESGYFEYPAIAHQRPRRVFPWGWTWGPKEPLFGQLESVYVQLSSALPQTDNDLSSLELKAPIAAKIEAAAPGSYVFFGHLGVPEWLRKTDKPFCSAEANHSCVDSSVAPFAGYDIDNSGVRSAWLALGDAVVRAVKRGQDRGTNLDFSHIYLLANEPEWPLSKEQPETPASCAGYSEPKDGPSVSKATIARFVDFLADRYEGIAQLNENWGRDLDHDTEFLDFRDLRSRIRSESPTLGGVLRPPFLARNVVDSEGKLCRRGKIGSAIWNDWTEFNMSRVQSWFGHLCGSISTAYHRHGVSGEPRCTVKVVEGKMGGEQVRFRPWQKGENALRWVPSTFDHGIDMQALVRGAYQQDDKSWRPHQGVVGVDMRLEGRGLESYRGRFPLPGRNPSPNDDQSYVLYWKRQSMFLDFARSLAPQKMVFDSEWHGLSGIAWRDAGLSADYVRAAVWLAYGHGLGAMQTWYWGRNEDGSPTEKSYDGFFGSVTTQPIALDAFLQAQLEVNTASPELTTLVDAPREVFVWYDPVSARQDDDYGRQVVHAYESVYFTGYPIGFLTPWAYQSLSQAERDAIRVVIVPKGEHASDWAIAQFLDLAARQSGRVDPATLIILGARNALSRTPDGTSRINSAVDALKKTGSAIFLDNERQWSPSQMFGVIDRPPEKSNSIRSSLDMRPLECRNPDQPRRHIWGIMCRSAFHYGVDYGGTNAPVLWVANLRDSPQPIRIVHYGETLSSVRDALTGETRHFDALHGLMLQPSEVLLLTK
ncbi:MAG: hypothetical protein AAF654_08110 [Myxococcota bacterium]